MPEYDSERGFVSSAHLIRQGLRYIEVLTIQSDSNKLLNAQKCLMETAKLIKMPQYNREAGGRLFQIPNIIEVSSKWKDSLIGEQVTGA